MILTDFILYDFFFKNSKTYFLYFFLKKNVKSRKIFIKKINGKFRNIKNDSYRRDKNIDISNRFINVSLKNGKKLNFLKNWNLFLKNFFLSFNKNNSNISHYKNYDFFLDLFNNKYYYHDINLLIKKSITVFEPLFNIKVNKINKKFKNKFNKKYSYDIIYIKKKKRLKHVLKLINSYSERFKNYRCWERLYWSFISILLEPKNSFLWKRKMFVYKKALKKLFKKN